MNKYFTYIIKNEANDVGLSSLATSVSSGCKRVT